MGQQQLFLLVLGAILVGISIIVGISMFSTGAVHAESDALLRDVNEIASKARAYFRRLPIMGGGGGSFKGAADVTVFGADSANIIGSYVMSLVKGNEFTLTGIGATEGVIVVAIITKNGISGTIITLP